MAHPQRQTHRACAWNNAGKATWRANHLARAKPVQPPPENIPLSVHRNISKNFAVAAGAENEAGKVLAAHTLSQPASTNTTYNAGQAHILAGLKFVRVFFSSAYQSKPIGN